mgnify:CR=1 FL=1
MSGYLSHNFIQCLAFVSNELNLYSVFFMYLINQNYIQWFAQAFITVTSNLHSMDPWNMYCHEKSATLRFYCVIRVYFYSVLACTFKKVIYFCVKKFLLSIYHDWECVSSVMTISSFCFLDTQRFMKHRCDGEGVLSAVYF